MNTAHYDHTATLLPNGKVLVAGGNSGGNLLASAELYDPATGTWTTTGSLNIAREIHRAILLPNGKVLVVGGYNGSTAITSVELYDPAFGTWSTTSAMNTARHLPSAMLLPNGKVLVAGGNSGVGSLASSELYDVGLGYSSSWQPQITSFTSPLISGGKLTLTGTRFWGISGASGGNYQNSSSDNPVVQLRSLENGQTIFLNATNWSTNSYASTVVTNLPTGWIMVTMFVNGIPSPSVITLNPLGYNQISSRLLSGNQMRLYFVGIAGTNYALDRTFNLLPPANWVPQATNPGGGGGVLVFTNAPNTSTNNFWRIRSVP
jgi:hypothetical protein